MSVEATSKILENNAPPFCPRVNSQINRSDYKFGSARILSQSNGWYYLQCTGCLIKDGRIIPAYSGAGHNNGKPLEICERCQLRISNIYQKDKDFKPLPPGESEELKGSLD
jgi:hypothetical protein